MISLSSPARAKLAIIGHRLGHALGSGRLYPLSRMKSLEFREATSRRPRVRKDQTPSSGLSLAWLLRLLQLLVSTKWRPALHLLFQRSIVFIPFSSSGPPALRVARGFVLKRIDESRKCSWVGWTGSACLSSGKPKCSECCR